MAGKKTFKIMKFEVKVMKGFRTAAVLFLAGLLLFTGCAKKPQPEEGVPSATVGSVTASPVPTRTPGSTASGDETVSPGDTDAPANTSVPGGNTAGGSAGGSGGGSSGGSGSNTGGVVPPSGGGDSSIIEKNLIPAVSSNFNSVSSVSQTAWTIKYGSVSPTISSSGYGGTKCLYYTKAASSSENYFSPAINLAPYITSAGYYTIRFQYKVAASGEVAPFTGLIRGTAADQNSFIQENNGNYYANLVTAPSVQPGKWQTYEATFKVQAGDVKTSANWNFCVHLIADQVTGIYIDNFELITFIDNTKPSGVSSAVTWVANEVVLVSDRFYDDAFNDVDVDLVLTNGSVTYTIPGFWDGSSVWRIRFVCPSAGTWTYKTVCTNTKDTGLHNQTGRITCTNYSGSLEIYKRGFVKTVSGTRYFMYNDGTPFFYLGDTHWSLGSESLDMVKTIAAHRAKQGYTVIQSEPLGATFSMANGMDEGDVIGFRANDQKFQAIAAQGLVHANAQFFFPHDMDTCIENHGGYSSRNVSLTVNGSSVTIKDLSDQAKTYLKKLSRYWVARYSAYPVMWTLGQEVDNDFYWDRGDHLKWNFVNNPYKLVAEYIDQYDPYSHPLTAHQENTFMTAALGNGYGAGESGTLYLGDRSDTYPSAFRKVKAHTWYAAQWSPSLTSNYDYAVAKDYWYNGQGKPVVNYEGRYCYLWTKNFGARMQGWTAYLNGMFGYGWGGHDTWSYGNIYNEDVNSSDGVDTITSAEKKAATWRDSLEYASSYQTGYMKNFFSTFDWWNLIPRFDDTAYFRNSSGVYSVTASNSSNTKMVIYFYSFYDKTVAANNNTGEAGGRSTGTIGNLSPNTTYKYKWFNPITGQFSAEGSFTSSSSGTYSIGNKMWNGKICYTDMVFYMYR